MAGPGQNEKEWEGVGTMPNTHNIVREKDEPRTPADHLEAQWQLQQGVQKIITQIEERLQPVLLPDDREEKVSGEKEDYHGVPPLIQQIKSNNSGLSRILTELHNIERRIVL